MPEKPSAIAPEERHHRRAITAWCMYDWANSAFATTILAAVLPVYYSQVAGGTLPSEAVATAYWSLGLSLSLLIVAIISPILGTVSDLTRGKKRLLSIFASLGIIGTGLLVLVDTGDWLLASILFIVGRIGFTGANVFYDAILPHVARPEEQDSVSARGYAFGYLGGGLLLAINVVMLQYLPGTWGPRLSFLSVAIWWAVFSIPLLTIVREPPAAALHPGAGLNVITVTFRRLWETLKDVRRYRELFKYLIAFLIYNDGIGTIIGVAAIYGAELGFGSTQLVLALLLVQFVGIPFSLVFGRLPSPKEKRRPFFLAFVLFNLVALPLVGIVGGRVLPSSISGSPPAPYVDTMGYVGEGIYVADDAAFSYSGDWERQLIPADEIGAEADVLYWISTAAGARYDLPFNGQQVEVIYSTGPDHGIWSVEIDGQPFYEPRASEPLTINAYNSTIRYGVTKKILAAEPGAHTLSLVNSGEKDERSQGTALTVAQVEVLPPLREGNLGVVLGIILGVEVLGILFALLTGRPFFSQLASRMDTKNSIILALVLYAAIAIWGFFLNSVLEFWMLAWMVAIVQGGSQALSRSLYARMAPAAKSGEFFGLFGIMEKFSSIIGPILFAAAVALFDSSRPAVLSLIVLFFLGIFLLTRVNVAEGQRVAQEEDAALLGRTED
jgi:UMF1 family MFS transporter